MIGTFTDQVTAIAAADITDLNAVKVIIQDPATLTDYSVGFLDMLTTLGMLIPKVNIALIGTLDGVNKVFTLPDTPIANTESITDNILMARGTGYTIVGATVTFANAPQRGDNLVASYYLKAA